MQELLKELKRRSIFKVAVAYILVGWILVQVAAAIESLVEMPDWFGALVLTLIVIGFPIAMILAWAYEVTPEGIKKAGKKSKSKKSTNKHSPVDLTIIAALILTVIYLIYQPADETETLAFADRPSIAVIPFENMSGTDENEQFTNGLHDDLLTQLSKIKNLRVISRTSVLEYRDTKKNMIQIGEELGVGSIIEGGVQRIGDRVRINVQLIDAKTDEHLWAETYDKKLTVQSLFDIQSEIAHKIASTLKISMSRSDDKKIFTVPTKNMEAYEAYLKGKEMRQTNMQTYNSMGYQYANNYLNKAIMIDPEFAGAWTEFSINYFLLYFNKTKDPIHAELGKLAADRAKQISPEIAEVHEAFAYYHYYVTVHYDKALEEINKALALKPNDSMMINTRGFINRRSGRFVDAINDFKQVSSLDPSSRAHNMTMTLLFMLRRYNEMIDTLNNNIYQKEDNFMSTLLMIAKMNKTGNVEQYLNDSVALFKKPDLRLVGQEAILDNLAFDAPVALFQELMEYAQNNNLEISLRQHLKIILMYRTGKIEEAKQIAFKLIPEVKKQIEQFPKSFEHYYNLLLLNALLDDKEETQKSIEKILHTFPYEKDQFQSGLYAIRSTVSAYAFIGEKEKAIRMLDKYLGLPRSDSLAKVKLDFTMEGMENWPGYNKLVETHGLHHKDYSGEPMLEFGERFSGYAFKKDKPIE
ncbi:MAG: hypothetical protein OEY96_09590 [Gammaproteobacteria bacterium]|nr:hypothetical protein [Gammaproteobacteria bacterium]